MTGRLATVVVGTLAACAAPARAPSPDAATSVSACASAVPAFYAAGCTIEDTPEMQLAAACETIVLETTEGNVCWVWVGPWLDCMAAQQGSAAPDCAACNAAFSTLTEKGC